MKSTLRQTPRQLGRHVNVKLLLCASAALWLCGCANVQMPAAQPSMDNVNAAKQVLAGPVNVGDFSLAKGLSPDVDQVISVRGSNSIHAPGGQSFSSHLRDVLVTDLRAAGKFDPAATMTITAQLTKSELEAGMSTGTGTLGAHFVVTRPGGVCLDKDLVATAEWPSSFIAAVAVPDAFNHYTALYPALAGKLLQDADFKRHCASKP